ncbi:MAG TPA: ABC transporter permease [Puia sp.]|jgi:ABC-type antimicrobial peptide transport system permease subunit
MFKSYITTAWRNLVSNKTYSALNILGLAIGMAVALIIGLWVVYQYTYDRTLPGYQQAYVVRNRVVRNGDIQIIPATPLPLADALKKEIPEVQYVAHGEFGGKHGLVAGDKKIYDIGLRMGEDFLKIFQFPLVAGNVNSVFDDPYSIVLTRATAVALFGNEDPMGKMVHVDNADDLKVTGVLEDLPANTSFPFKFIIPFSYAAIRSDYIKRASNAWNMTSSLTYVSLRPGVSQAQVEPKLKLIMKKYDPQAYKTLHSELFLYAEKDWHLYSDFKNGVPAGGFIEYVRMFSIIGALVLLIGCVNFMNLSTARSEKRAREVGVRKAMGSRRKDLIFQFLIESVVMTCIAFFLSLLLVQASLPAFRALTSAKISIPYGSPVFWSCMAGYVLLTGVLAGARPAFYLSSFQPVKVLKGDLKTGKAAALPRKILVVLQFSCSIALIISTFIIYQQIQYAKDRPVGYTREGLVVSQGSSDLTRNYPALKHDLLQSGMIASVTRSQSPATDIWNWNNVEDWQGRYPDETLLMATITVDDDYFRTMGMQIKEGRDFTGNAGADSLSVILNEAAVRRLRYEGPLNQTIAWGGGQHLRVVGVVRDAMMTSPFSAAEPTFFLYQPNESENNILYRISPGVNTHEAIAKVSAIFNKYNPAYPYTYTFTDVAYATKFNQETLVGRLAGLFAGLAIFISCLGLFGLAAYMAEQRNKEIGIRKILGASVAQLWLLLSRDFIVLVLISCVIAAPAAVYFLHGWLQKYSYRIGIGPGVLIFSALLAVAITVVTISWQTIRAALANPVKNLRRE